MASKLSDSWQSVFCKLYSDNNFGNYLYDVLGYDETSLNHEAVDSLMYKSMIGSVEIIE